jgi:beta-lactamase superfamily II metal-dependent hydrolase
MKMRKKKKGKTKHDGESGAQTKANAAPASGSNGIPFLPPPGGVGVRMYRTGLGDCFLLAFCGNDDQPRYMLIDCGVWKGTPCAQERMKRIMQHISDSTYSHLHVVVITHEHWDHLSGFHQAGAIFKGITVDQVWMGWTENPADEVANELRKKRLATIATLQAAIRRLDQTPPDVPADSPVGSSAITATQRPQSSRWAPTSDSRSSAITADRIRMLLDFFGASQPQNAAGGAAALAAGPTTANLMDIVRGRVRQPRYCYPGKRPLRVRGVSGVRIYVLGPPIDRKRLFKSIPSRGPASEVYFTGLTLDSDAAFYAAAELAWRPDTLTLVEQETLALSFPFDKCYRIPSEEAKNRQFFKDYYGFDLGHQGPAWRRIGTDWLEVAGQLALDLDNNTNNTSLVLAIEVGKGGPVLLFPGDAQVGNWLSWDDYSWPGLTAEDLLRRTVLYKVGHHASHNATLREKGLMRMTNPEFAVMIPVDEAEAHKPKGQLKEGWEMPYKPLLSALTEKARDRVMRSDKGIPSLESEQRSPRMSESEWKAFQQDTVVDELFIDYRVVGS